MNLKTSLKNLKRNIKINNLFILIGLILIPVVHPKVATGLDFTDSISHSTRVSASVPDNYLTLTGYSSANAKIELENSITYAATYADKDGFFKFERLLLPKNQKEFCLTATDASLRKSTPVCLPPIPASKINNTIGPVILPPTITLDSAKIDAYSTTFVSGESIPNSPVYIHLYQAKDKASLIAKPAQAFSFPTLMTQSDSSGHYSFSLPTTYSSNYRLYSSVNFQDNLSPKSNTLTYKLPSMFSFATVLLICLFGLTLILFITLIVLFYNQKEPCLNTIATNH